MNDDEHTNPPQRNAIERFWHELKRRKVVRVATVYLVTGWLIIQVADSTFGGFGIPDWAFRFVALMVALGFPVAVILAWAFELTPDGIKTSRPAAVEGKRAATSPTLAKQRNWTAFAFGALAPTVIFGALAMFFYFQGQGGDGDSGAPLGNDEAGRGELAALSIAMMPLVNMSALEENEYFAGGIHEDVLTNLSRLENFQVISRTSMLRYAASDLSLREIGDELGVDYIVEGSVRRIGDHVRVTIQLINAQSDIHLWANNYERELIDEFATQSALAREISDSIHLELQPESVGALEGMPTASVKAYDLYIKAESLEKTEGETEESVVRRLAMLEEAVAEDPDFVEAWAVLKRLYDLQLDRLRRRGWYVAEGEDIGEVASAIREKRQRAMDKAVALDPGHPETLLAQAVNHDWPKPYEEMQREKLLLDKIIAIDPDNAKAWYHLGHWHAHRDDYPDHDLDALTADATAAFEEALRLDPFNARMVSAVLTWYRNRGFEDDVQRMSARLAQIVPETAEDRSLARVSWNFRRRQIREALFETGDEIYIEEYERAWAEAVADGDYTTLGFRYLDEWTLSGLKNDTDRLIELSHTPLNLDESEWNPFFFSILRGTGIRLHAERGEVDQARELAQVVIDNQDILVAQDLEDCTCYLGVIADAYSFLGDEEEAGRWSKRILDTDYPDLTDQVFQYNYMELDNAVAKALVELEKDPSWRGFDEIASYHVDFRPFLAHPKIQQYYLNEGKWIDFLAKRVPEYAKYSDASSN